MNGRWNGEGINKAKYEETKWAGDANLGAEPKVRSVEMEGRCDRSEIHEGKAHQK